MNELKQIRENVNHVKVLYVEDEEQVRKMTLEFLKKIFTYVDSAVDGQDGLDLFKKNEYNLVISDLKMPKMDGSTMLTKIKELDKDVVLFAMTASNSSIDMTSTICDVYLHKPIKLGDFIEALESQQERLQNR